MLHSAYVRKSQLCEHPYLDCDCGNPLQKQYCNLCAIVYEAEGLFKECVVCPQFYEKAQVVGPAKQVQVRIVQDVHDGQCSDEEHNFETTETLKQFYVPQWISVLKHSHETRNHDDPCGCGLPKTVTVLSVKETQK